MTRRGCGQPVAHAPGTRGRRAAQRRREAQLPLPAPLTVSRRHWSPPIHRYIYSLPIHALPGRGGGGRPVGAGASAKV
eukprot:scaffold29043_cov112-Isochrysis_galbana.AAC.3